MLDENDVGHLGLAGVKTCLRVLGLGDVKLIAMIAAFLGFWPAVLALFLGTILCSAYALTLMLRGRANALTRLPLGTFLSIGGLLAALIGPPLIAWYTSLL